ncbi:MAG: hypothetical protein LBS61_00610 [Endomicrobium sp.]|nr:hypothetical protein [Endomicrobium sp.]
MSYPELLFLLPPCLSLNAQNPRHDQKILVAYFSWGGNTKKIAEQIHEAFGGDLFEIKTVKAYPKDYEAVVELARKQKKDNARPALSKRVKDMDSYDIVFLWYPDWIGAMPMPVFTFLESYNFNWKTIIPFCTHGGSKFGSSISDIKKIRPKAYIKEGLAVRASNVGNAKDEVDVWLSKFGMLKQ